MTTGRRLASQCTLATAVALTALLSVPSPADARRRPAAPRVEPPPPRPEPRVEDPALARARAAFERGELDYRLSRFEEALKHYQEALAAKRLPAFLFNIAQCYRNLKRYDRARFYYRLYLSEAPTPSNAAEVRQRIEEMDRELAAAERRRPVSVSVTSSPPGAEVFVDRRGSAPAARTPAVLKLPPGAHLVILRLAGHREEVRRVEVRPGQPVVLQAALVPAVPRAPYYRRWWFWTGMSAAAVMVGVAAGTGAQALRMKDQWERTGGQPDVSYDFRARSLALRVTTDVLLGAAALTVAATVIGAAVVGRGSAEPEGATTRVLPSCGPGGCGVWVQGRF